MKKERIELNVHTKMSAMDAVTSISEYIKRAAKWGYTAIAVTDHGCVQAFPEAMRTAEECERQGHKIKILYGMEAYCADDEAQPFHLTILVKSQTGLKNLFRLVSWSHLHNFQGVPMITKEELQKHRAGLLLGSGCGNGKLFRAAALTFAAESTVSFENKSEKELVMIFVQDTNEDESVPAPAVTNDSDSIKLEIDENGVINLHKHVASEDKVNVKEPACTEEGYTGDTVCADCGEVIEQGETIPATGHKYENGVCTVCGESDPNYESSVPSTGENGSMILWVSLLALSLGAVAVLAVRAGKKA